MTVTRWLAQLAEALGFKQYAATIRAKKNEEARLLIQEIFTKLREDAAPARNAWTDAADPAFSSNSVQSANQSWSVTEPGTGDAFIRSIQNNKIDVKRVRDAIAEKYGKVAESKDAYLNEELYHGRVAARVSRIYDEQVEPILKKIAVAGKNVGLTMDDVNTYLHARHAPERNAAMKAINPSMKDNDALSGMSDTEAAKVLADFKAAGKDSALSLIAADVDQMLSEYRTNLVADGLEDAGAVSAWEAAYKHYVPLQRDIKGGGTPKGNFNRKGNMTPVVNSLYMFFNASVQGTARLAQAIATSKTARAAVGGVAAMGFLLDMLNRMSAGDDDETKRNRYDLIPEFEKSRNWIFMNPMRPGEYVKVPLPLGPHVFHNAGRLMSDAIFRKDPRNASEYAWSMAGVVLDAFSPLGSSPSLGQLISPSVLDPVVQLTENKSFTGAPVYKSADKGFGKTDPKPAYTRHFDSTPDVWIGASKMLNDATGGDKVKPGAIDINPDILKHVFYTMTGGPGRTLDQAIDMTQAEARGKEVTVNRVPFASRFYGANDDAQRERTYYDDKKRVLDAKQTFDYYNKNGKPEEARKVAADLGDGDPAKGRKKMMEFSATDKSVRKINGAIRQQLERDDDGEAKSEQLKALRQRRMRVMSNALDDE